MDVTKSTVMALFERMEAPTKLQFKYKEALQAGLKKSVE